jgi:hypothetical protein
VLVVKPLILRGLRTGQEASGGKQRLLQVVDQA